MSRPRPAPRAALGYDDFRALLEGARLPCALVDLDALERNVDRLAAQIHGTGKTLRVASKSVRHVGLLRRILERGGAGFVGVMCFSLEEAAHLVDHGFDDLLVAYPSVGRAALAEVAARVAEGATIRLVADDRAHLDAYAEAGRAAGVVLDVVLELDVAYRPAGGRLHLGALRSPLRDPRALVALARAAEALPDVRFVGLMGYEAHIAGLTDDNPFSRALNPARRAFKRVAMPAVVDARREAVAALREAGLPAALVNGGGTGSVPWTAREPWVTEVTAGSGFLCPHLFDYYVDGAFEPAAFFALEVCRTPEPGVVTCLGGGYVASGEPGWDRLPLPHAPAGLSYVAAEGAGEVQTPLRVEGRGPRLEVGDPVVFRHAKAGELAERFAQYLLVRGRAVQAREPTYRGEGRCFF